MGVALRITTQPQDVSDGSGAHRGHVASDQTPRIPCIGLDAGAIPGTKPGCSARELDRNAQDIIRSRMALARRKLQYRD